MNTTQQYVEISGLKSEDILEAINEIKKITHKPDTRIVVNKKVYKWFLHNFRTWGGTNYLTGTLFGVRIYLKPFLKKIHIYQ